MKIQRKATSAEVPSMAMGDIAFNLLIFFVILARAQDDSHLKWKPAVTPELEHAGHPKASIVVDVKNRLFLNGRQIGIASLSKRVEELLGTAPAGERTVLLKIDSDATASKFEPIIEAVSEAGGEVVHVLEKEKEK